MYILSFHFIVLHFFLAVPFFLSHTHCDKYHFCILFVNLSLDKRERYPFDITKRMSVFKHQGLLFVKVESVYSLQQYHTEI